MGIEEIWGREWPVIRINFKNKQKLKVGTVLNYDAQSGRKEVKELIKRVGEGRMTTIRPAERGCSESKYELFESPKQGYIYLIRHALIGRGFPNGENDRDYKALKKAGLIR